VAAWYTSLRREFLFTDSAFAPLLKETRFGLNRSDALVRREAVGDGVVFVGPCLGKGPGPSK